MKTTLLLVLPSFIVFVLMLVGWYFGTISVHETDVLVTWHWRKGDFGIDTSTTMLFIPIWHFAVIVFALSGIVTGVVYVFLS